MQHKKNGLVLALLVSTAATGTAQAALVARTGGMVYDDVNKITWAADANLFKTQAAGNTNLVSQIIHNIMSIGTHTLTNNDFNANTGKMTWWGAQAWVNNLTLGGFTDWSLPGTPVVAYGGNLTSSQMGDLYYNQLGGKDYKDIATTNNGNYSLFTNVNRASYWSGTEYTGYVNYAWKFDIGIGEQYHNPMSEMFYGLAVRAGDVAAVPLPGAIWLFLTGIIGVMGLKRRKNIS
ncbi:DUF1566 domain-containing protein [Methylobacter sp. S3L5C]|uniref:DUF1566 domain-containing protein n=1 Tax=Methylobacter sp. S3L5C TaxID=2839024 RepID=UPI001FAC4876|nr:DUF1566 domain-containing protein [Methylobacter sp. S3L5C]UOA09827.1 DUF1566 domain-containing protein [Methylobacter sp. S3L5C]